MAHLGFTLKLPPTLFILLLCSLACAPLSAQTYIMAQGSFSSCTGLFTDSGGQLNGYGNNEDIVLTICSDNSTGSHIRLEFDGGFDLGAGDDLCFFDGVNTAANQLSCASDYNPGQSVVIQATAANPSGCLTLQFQSDNADTGAGWLGSISCVPSCQTIFGLLDSISPAPQAGETWIEICPGEEIHLEAIGEYPQNGLVYNHSDNTSEFFWDFGDGAQGVGQSVSHTYQEGGGYTIALTVVDQFGCSSINFLDQDVRVAPPPRFDLVEGIDSFYCSGDPLALAASIGPGSGNVEVNPGTGSFQVGQIRSDSLELPDGTGVPYETSITFTQFAPGQLLTSINDLLGICVNIEHSFMRDLQISLSCPNGNSVILHNFAGQSGGEVYLGAPIDADGAFPTPGAGLEYCWVPNASNGTWLDYANTFLPDTLPSGDYASFENLNALVGCPLNGEWTIRVEDLWPVDNGFIFSWGINFDGSLFPNLVTFSPGIDDLYWVDNHHLDTYSSDSLSSNLPHAGTAKFELVVEDEFGCLHDTLLQTQVRSPLDTACRSCSELLTLQADTLICIGDSIPLVTQTVFQEIDTVSFGSQPGYSFGFSNHPPGNPYLAELDIDLPLPVTLTDPLTQINEVCMDIETDWLADLQVFLEAPDGSLLELTTDNGGDQDNYTQTCFSPAATTPITAGIPPFTGTFQPEGNWNDLSNSPVNGTWTLRVSDAFGPTEMGVFNSWNISFILDNMLDVSWKPASGLSCDDCPNPIASPSTDIVYTVEVTDLYGCVQLDTVEIMVDEPIPAPTVTCEITAYGQITFSWTGMPTGIQAEYQIITNGVPTGWIGPYNDSVLVVGNQTEGTTVEVQVRAWDAPNLQACAREIGSTSCAIPACNLSASIVSGPQDVSCFMGEDGNIALNALNTNGQATYTLLPGNTTNQDGLFENLGTGNYTIVVEDEVFCSDTLNFDIGEPAAVITSYQILSPILCGGDSNGSVEAIPFGGVGNFSFEWEGSPAQDQAVINGLAAGSYGLTVTDGNGCTDTITVVLDEPDSLLVSLSGQSPLCDDSANGQLTATASGGTGLISLSWSNGGTGQNQTGLPAGSYCVTAQDVNGCQVSECLELVDPAPVVADSIVSSDVLCAGQSNGTATVYPSGGTGPYTFQWNDPSGQINATANNLPAGDFQVIITDDNGCSGAGNVSIQEPQPINLQLSHEDIACRGDSTGTATVQATGGVPPYDLNWSNGQQGPEATGLSAGNWTVILTDQNGCTEQSSVTITQPAQALQLQLTQTRQGCAGASDNEALALATGGSGGNYTFVWSNGLTGSSLSGLDSVSYSVTLTDANGCTLADTLRLNDLDPIDFFIQAKKPSCPGDNDGSLGISIISGGAGGEVDDYTFQWSNNATGPLINNLAGETTYTVTVTDSIGCTTTRSRLLPDPDSIQFELISSPALCADSASGTASIINLTGENPPYAFNWGAEAGGQSGATANNLAAGVYTVTITDDLGCAGSGIIEVVEPPVLVIDFDSEPNDCHGDSEGLLEATVRGGVPGYSFIWSSGETGSSLSNLPSDVYELTVTDANGCQMIDTVVVEQPAPIDISLDITDVTCHGGSDGIITVGATGGTGPYQYSLNNRDYIGSTSLLGLQADNYQVFVRDKKGCVNSISAAVGQPPAITVEAGPPEISILLGDSLELSATVQNAQGMFDLFWEGGFSGTLSCMSCAQPVASPLYTIDYTVSVIDSAGCEAEDRLRVRVTKPRTVEVPTGFSPNGDGMNDLLVVHGRSGTRILSFQVFNRWGELLYQRIDFPVNEETIGWDGTFRGEEVHADVYLWHLEAEYVDGAREAFRGHTTLIR